MSHWVVTIQDFSGSQKKLRVEAENADQACRAAGFHPSSVLSVDRDTLADVFSSFTSPAPSLNIQQMVLSNLSAMVEAGASGEQAIKALLTKVTYLKYDPESLVNCQTAPEFLRALRFDKMVVLLARAGQDSGDLAGALYRAAQYVEDQIKIKEESGKGITGGLIKIGMGLSAAIILPLVMGPQIENFMGMKGMTMRPNIFTDILLAIMRFEHNYWWLVPIVFAIGFVARKQLFNAIKTYPFFSLWVQLAAIKRGIAFISTYAVMIQAKIPTDKAIAMMASEASIGEKVIYDELLKNIREGSLLADALEPELWPESLRSGMSSFDRINEDQRHKVLLSLSNNLRLEQRALMRAFERIAGVVGMGTLIMAILIGVIGFYLPIITLTPQF